MIKKKRRTKASWFATNHRSCVGCHLAGTVIINRTVNGMDSTIPTNTTNSWHLSQLRANILVWKPEAASQMQSSKPIWSRHPKTYRILLKYYARQEKLKRSTTWKFP